MSRPRTPDSVLELKGAFKKNPKRGELRAMEPRAEAALTPPQDFLRTDLSLYAQLLEIWRETVAVCWWLTAAEAAPLESYCRLKNKERRGTAKSPDLTNLFKLYPILGMTQDGRARFVGAGPRKGRKDGEEGWEALQNEAQRVRAV